jgi:hypothetical protein
VVEEYVWDDVIVSVKTGSDSSIPGLISAV